MEDLNYDINDKTNNNINHAFSMHNEENDQYSDNNNNNNIESKNRNKLLVSSVGKMKKKKVCVIEGTLNTTSGWYGFLGNFSVQRGSRIQYYFNYPHHMQIVQIILYRDEELPRFVKCWYDCEFWICWFYFHWDPVWEIVLLKDFKHLFFGIEPVASLQRRSSLMVFS